MHFCYLDRLNDWYMELMSSPSSFVSGYSSLLRLLVQVVSSRVVQKIHACAGIFNLKFHQKCMHERILVALKSLYTFLFSPQST